MKKPEETQSETVDKAKSMETETEEEEYYEGNYCENYYDSIKPRK